MRAYTLVLTPVHHVPVEGDVVRHHFRNPEREPVLHLVLGSRTVKHRRELPAGYTTVVRLTVERHIPAEVFETAVGAGGRIHDTYPEPRP